MKRLSMLQQYSIFITYCFYTYCKPPHPTCHHSPHGHRKPTHSECIDQILIYRPILLVHKFVQLKKIRNWHENTMPISCKKWIFIWKDIGNRFFCLLTTQVWAFITFIVAIRLAITLPPWGNTSTISATKFCGAAGCILYGLLIDTKKKVCKELVTNSFANFLHSWEFENFLFLTI